MKEFFISVLITALMVGVIALLAHYIFGAPSWAALCTGMIMAHISTTAAEAKK